MLRTPEDEQGMLRREQLRKAVRELVVALRLCEGIVSKKHSDKQS